MAQVHVVTTEHGQLFNTHFLMVLHVYNIIINSVIQWIFNRDHDKARWK